MSTSYKNINITRTSYKDKYGGNTFEYGKVVEIFNDTGNIKKEGTIKVSSTLTKASNLAYPINFGIQQLPLLGEIVPIYYNSTLEKYYYGPAVNVHNFPTHNSTDPIVQETVNFNEPVSINPYRIFTGDTILQGRFGQSIRLSQPVPQKTPWEGSLGSSSIIISSGQVGTSDGSDLLVEDINTDAASLYMLEQSKVSLLDLSKRDSYEEQPLKADQYLRNQAVLNSDRLYLNAREDSILLSAQSGSIGLSGNTVNLDGVNSIRLDAPSYNLQADTFTTTNESRTVDSQTSTYNYDQFNLNGTNITIDHSRIALGQNAVHPLIQSNELMADLTLLTSNISSLSTALSGVVALLAALPGGQAPAAALQAAATGLQTQATSIQTKASSGTYLSTKAFTE